MSSRAKSNRGRLGSPKRVCCSSGAVGDTWCQAREHDSLRPPLPSYSALDVADCSPSPASLPQMGYCPISQLVTPPRQRSLLQRRKSRFLSLEGSSLSRTTSFTSAYDDEGYDASGSSCGYDSSRHEGDEHTGESWGFKSRGGRRKFGTRLGVGRSLLAVLSAGWS